MGSRGSLDALPRRGLDVAEAQQLLPGHWPQAQRVRVAPPLFVVQQQSAQRLSEQLPSVQVPSLALRQVTVKLPELQAEQFTEASHAEAEKAQSRRRVVRKIKERMLVTLSITEVCNLWTD
jgi:hypothetical protein